jgi:hypothetical protein
LSLRLPILTDFFYILGFSHQNSGVVKVKLSHVHDVKACGEWKYSSSHTYLTWALVEVNGQLHSLAALLVSILKQSHDRFFPHFFPVHPLV